MYRMSPWNSLELDSQQINPQVLGTGSATFAASAGARILIMVKGSLLFGVRKLMSRGR